jgi:hypothetical protein
MIKSFLFVWLILISPIFHPLHVSVTEINFDEKDKALEIMIRVFADDLETTLRKNQNIPDLDIQNPKGKTLDQMMQEYLKGRFAVKLDGKPGALQYLGNEKDGEAFVFYVEVSKVRRWDKIEVTNTILTEVFDDQSNLVHVTAGSDVRSLRLNAENVSGVVTFGK